MERFQNIFFLLKYFMHNKRFVRKLCLTLGISISALFVLFKILKNFYGKKNSIKSSRSLNTIEKTTLSTVTLKDAKKKRTAPTLDRKFIKQFTFLLKIMFPKLLSRQVILLVTHTFTLMCRTFLSIYVAHLEGILVKNIVQRSFYDFSKNLIKWLALGLPATSTNSLIKYLESKLDLEVKSQLVNNSIKQYFENRCYYRIALKQSDESIQVDQNLTEDIDKFTQLFVHLYSQLTKPILDVTLITATLINLARKNNFNYFAPTFVAILIVSSTSMLMRGLSPKFGKMTQEIQKQKGFLRYLYTRIQTNSEEIAFYSGEQTESNLIKKNYALLKFELEKIYKSKLWYVVIEQFLLKYVWSAAGLIMISIPIILSDPNHRLTKNKNEGGNDENEMSARTEQFTTAKNLLVSAADAIERIMTSYKEIIELAGFTQRVYDMFQLFENVKNTQNFNKLNENKLSLDKNENIQSSLKLKPGIVFEEFNQNNIIVESIAVITPGGDIIVPSLSLKIEQGMNVLITGPNGCGKSSLFRIISGLWPLYNGKIFRPKISEMFYVPQRPYLVIGNLRDQIIYPDNINDMKRKMVSDNDLMNILEIVNLQQVVQREGGLNAVADWKDVLSGGEKQRIGLSRIFYHKPKFAFLDECTSAVSVDVEGKIYMKAIKEYNITLLTIAHRATLWQYHNYILQFDGHGNWKFEELNSNLPDRLNLKQEKDSLEKIVLNFPSTQSRLKELCNILGENSVALDEN